MDTSLFARGPSPTLRFILLLIASLGLMVADQRTTELERFRYWAGSLLHPIQSLVDLPARTTESISRNWATKQTLLEENQRLKERNRYLAAQLQEFVAIRNENDKLRNLLQAQVRPDNRVSSATLLAVSFSENQQRVLLDKGEKNGVVVGMAIVDDHGLMGQVTRTYALHAEGMMISDPSSAVPVQLVRNGLRDVLAGTGSREQLQLLHPAKNSDIIEGDLLVTSGLGGRFPPDFPVARIVSVEHPTDSMFAKVIAAPLASLEKSRNLLILQAVPRTVEPSNSATSPQEGLENSNATNLD